MSEQAPPPSGSLLERIQAALARRYAVRREIGRGGMATVFLARDMRHDRDVAIKVLRPELASTIGSDRFLQEIRTAARLSHPNILPLHDSGEVEGLLYYVMPYVPGESLRARLEREGPLPVADALAIAREVAEALSYAHSHDVVHRDIKPENILLDSGHALVTDFGIARAITPSGEQRLAEAGILTGTPAYMSPEQPGGKGPVDGRSDIYSLGCVLHEMLTGEPPFAGATAEMILARHLEESPRPVRQLRPSVPSRVESALLRALEKTPADRFATAVLFEEALAGPRPRFGTRWQWTIAGAAAAVLTLVVLGALPALRGDLALDPATVAVLPFQHRDGAAPELLSGDQCESLLVQALSQWEDLNVVDAMRVSDAIARRGRRISPADALTIARELSAGRYLWGEVAQRGDSVEVRAFLFDANRRGSQLSTSRVYVAPSKAVLGERFVAIAAELMAGTVRAPLDPAAVLGTTRIEAWTRLEEGMDALQGWDLKRAAARLRAAIALDPAFAYAQLWLAQILAWQREPAESWRLPARAALAGQDRLTVKDRHLAAAIAAMSEGRHAQACEEYEAVLRRDSLDFRAWLGLGDCRANDRVVVADAGSPSGWRFRGSYHAAVQAYRRALELVPSFNFGQQEMAYDSLRRLLFAERHRFRAGMAAPTAGRDSVPFAAFPGLAGDTLAFVPYPQAEVLSGQHEPARGAEAVARNQDLLLSLMRGWVRAFPDSAQPREGLALALESMARVRPVGDTLNSALVAVRRARGLARKDLDRLRLAVAEVRLQVKLLDIPATRRLADSLLAARPNPTVEEARLLAGLAALTGRVHRTAALMGRGAQGDSVQLRRGPRVALPTPLQESSGRLMGYAAFGLPGDSIRALARGFEAGVRSLVEAGERQDMREAGLRKAAELSFRELEPSQRAGMPPSYMVLLQQEVARGDVAAARRRFADLMRLRAGDRPGDVAIDGTLAEARIALALGDTAMAVSRLDFALEPNAIESLGTSLLAEPTQAAALGRAMALRAALATRAGDAATARRFAGHVTLLWSGADPELQPLLQQMER